MSTESTKVILHLRCGNGATEERAYLVSQEDWDAYKKGEGNSNLDESAQEEAAGFALSYGFELKEEEDDSQIEGWFELYNPTEHGNREDWIEI